MVWIRNLFDVLFPRPCIGCGGRRLDDGEFLCGLCRDHVPFILPPFCATCGQPGEMEYEYPTEDFECGLCRKNTYRFDRARSLGVYGSVLKELVHFIKYQSHPGAIGDIASLIEQNLKESGETYSGLEIIWVPLHRHKLKERGFDQSYVLADRLARLCNLPLVEGSLCRVRDTPPQARKTRAERMENVKGAFKVTCPERIAGRRLLVVDDVFTTGATVNEVAKVLKRAGADRVEVFTLARA
ncbi:double zinc ribbon domain-containing protein [Nitrospina sp. 32_T5]|uniref:double zinc ribbon domain-containing protein n=1 Tax=unclassified Nitrospina TaxID=2638683 RepID=UPI003F9A23C2